MEVFEGQIASMHQQQWGAEQAGGVVEASTYVNEVANSIAQFRWVVLATYIYICRM